MSDRRSQSVRRRRVISATVLAGAEASTSGSRLHRSATTSDPRRTTYGARVNRRLRARWFELVPVRRRSLLAVKLFVIVTVSALVIGHYLSMNWGQLREYPELSRPLRLDNPASFGGWIGATFMGLAAGISFLIYQVRRYRADDYRGKYRVWRPVIALLLILSVDSIAGLLDWSGAIIDVALAGKAPMAGGDWLRLVICIAGFALTARLCMEMRRSPVAVAWLCVGAIAISARLPIRWNFAEPSPLTGAMIIGAAPLMGRAAVFLGLLTFLRSVYREVRGLDIIQDGQSRFRLPRFGRRTISSGDDGGQYDDTDDHDEDRPRRWLGLFGSASESKLETEYEERPKRRWFGKRGTSDEDEKEQKPKRGWFRKDSPDDDEDEVDQEESEKPRRGWLGKKRSKSQDEPEDSGHDDGDAETKKRGGLGGWMRRSKETVETPSDPPKNVSTKAPESEDESAMDVDNIDWSSMSKSERRRMKKLLRRQGKDAA